MRNTTRRTVAFVGMMLCGAMVMVGCISQDQSTVQQQINAARSANNVTPQLLDFAAADTKAQAWANHLASLTCTPGVNCLSHTNLPDGYQAGTWCHLGENVGMGPNLDTIQTGFMNSPPHRANILNPVFDHVGSGVATNKATGYVFVVQEFVDAC